MMKQSHFLMTFVQILIAFIYMMKNIKGDTAQWPGGNSKCNISPRVRLPWKEYTAQDKKLFLDGMATIMKNGIYQKFVDIHTEARGNDIAHRTSAFILWHRVFILALENAIRDSGPKFKCFTLPYWTISEDYDDQLSKSCKGNLTNCSPIVTDICGDSSKRHNQYKEMNFLYNERQVNGSCYNNYPCNLGYNNCVLRGNLDIKPVPVNAGYGDLFALFSHNNFEKFTDSLRGGLHGNIHESLGGYMNTFTSPGDPIFYTWHSNNDMILNSFYECKLPKNQIASETVQKTSEYMYAPFFDKKYFSKAPDVTDEIAMYAKKTSTIMIHKDESEVVYKYFAPLKGIYWKYMNTRDLGDYSYVYKYRDIWVEMILDTPVCPGYHADNTDTTHQSQSSITSQSSNSSEDDENEDDDNKDDDKDDDNKDDDKDDDNKDDDKDDDNKDDDKDDDNKDDDKDDDNTDDDKDDDNKDDDNKDDDNKDNKGDYSTSSSSEDPDKEKNISSYRQWLLKVRKELEKLYPGDYLKQLQELEKMECARFYYTYGEQTTRPAFLKGQVTRSKICQDVGKQVVEGKIKLSVKGIDGNINNVRISPGMTPAPPSSPMAFPPIAPNIPPPDKLSPSASDVPQNTKGDYDQEKEIEAPAENDNLMCR